MTFQGSPVGWATTVLSASFGFGVVCFIWVFFKERRRCTLCMVYNIMLLVLNPARYCFLEGHLFKQPSSLSLLYSCYKVAVWGWPFALFLVLMLSSRFVLILSLYWWYTSVIRFIMHLHFHESLFYSPDSIRSAVHWSGTSLFRSTVWLLNMTWQARKSPVH